MSETLIYTVDLSKFKQHIFKIRLEIPKAVTNVHTLCLPTWLPGSYMIRDFAKHILKIEAFSLGKEIAVKRIDLSTFSCEANAPLVVEYEIYAFELTVRGAYLDSEQGYFNGSRLFLLPLGYEDAKYQCNILPLKEKNTWQLVTSLSKKTIDTSGFGSFVASNYDDLIDHPVQIGHFEALKFTVEAIEHTVAIVGKHNADLARLVTDLSAICRWQINFFGKPAPMQSYVFLLTLLNNAYNGLEHRSSTSLHESRENLPIIGNSEMRQGYRTLLGLFSHEYFHTWLIKNIKPQAFVPYDLRGPNFTEQLWIFEGFTAYYEDIALVQAKVIGAKDYLELLANDLQKYYRCSGRLKQTVVDSSFYAWTKFYKAEENAPNAIISYYTKGALIALCLDLMLLHESKGKSSLQHLLQKVWQEYGRTKLGVPEGAIEALISAKSPALAKFIYEALHTTNELPLNEVLALAGIKLSLYSSYDNKAEPKVYLSEEPRCKVEKGKIELGLGLSYEIKDNCIKVKTVLDNGAAQHAGIAHGDQIIAINGVRASEKNYQDLLIRAKLDDIIHILLFRDDILLEFKVKLAKEYILYITPVLSLYSKEFKPQDEIIKQQELSKQWLGVEL